MREELPRAVGTSIIVDKKSMFYHLFEFLAQEYGNDLEVLLKRLTTILMFGATSKFIKNQSTKTALKLTSKSLTIGLLGIDFLMHVKHYVKTLKEKQADPYKKRMLKFAELLNIKNFDDYNDIPNRECLFGPVLSIWFVQNPKIESKDLQIISYYDVTKNEKIENDIDFKSSETVPIGVLFKFKEELYLLDIEFFKTATGHININHSFLISEKKIDYSDLHKHLLRQYVNTLNIRDNVLKFDSWGGFCTSPRRKILEDLNQFDVGKLAKEIRWVLNHKGKRTYALVGKQGVGKSSVLRSIEYLLSDILIIHLTPDDFSYCSGIEDKFNTCKLFQPLIVMIEDLDACGLKEKNQITGAFLNCIDEVNRDLNMVIIYSVNDTSLIHPTIINRPGRSDIVREIKPPQNIKDVMKVIQNRLTVRQHTFNDFTLDINFNDAELKKQAVKCFDNNFTQAEIANGVIEYALIQIGLDHSDKKVISTELLTSYISLGIDSQLMTREAIKSCDFNNADPNEIAVVPENAECISKEAAKDYREIVRGR